jgi:hypothetical protein
MAFSAPVGNPCSCFVVFEFRAPGATPGQWSRHGGWARLFSSVGTDGASRANFWLFPFQAEQSLIIIDYLGLLIWKSPDVRGRKKINFCRDLTKF